MLVSLAAAFVAALCYGTASVMQAVAVRAASRRTASGTGERGTAPVGVDPGLLPRLLGQWRFVLSVLIDLAGFAAQLIALRRLPLFTVQAIVAANLAVIAVLASFVIGVTLTRREWLAVAGVVAGVGLLGSSAGAEGAAHPGTGFKVALIVATAVVGGCGLLAGRLRDPSRTLLLGTVAGLGYGLLGIAARVLTGFAPIELVKDPAAYAVLAGGVVSFVFYTAALEGGSVTVATAAVILAETLPPALIGVLFLGDTTRPGLAPVAAVGFVLAVASAVLLARFGEPEHPPEHPAKPAEPANSRQSDGADKRPVPSTDLGGGRQVLSWWPVDLRL